MRLIYPQSALINKERKRTKKKERLLLTLTQKADISKTLKSGHF